MKHQNIHCSALIKRQQQLRRSLDQENLLLVCILNIQVLNSYLIDSQYFQQSYPTALHIVKQPDSIQRGLKIGATMLKEQTKTQLGKRQQRVDRQRRQGNYTRRLHDSATHWTLSAWAHARATRMRSTTRFRSRRRSSNSTSTSLVESVRFMNLITS